MTDALHTYRYGPAGAVQVLAIHGLTGHGRRWEPLAIRHLADVAVAAPDLIGHGRSSWSAPWTLEANVGALSALLEAHTDAPVLVVGHSFGGAIALHLAAARPDLVGSLVLLDPAIGMDGEWMRVIADAMLDSPDYSDRQEARDEKISGSWADVDLADVDIELDEHLITLPNGRCGWRISIPAMMSYWSELARDIVLPGKGTPTTLVRAKWTEPPYVGDALLAALSERLGPDFTYAEFECEHMVAQALPVQTAALIRQRLSDG